PPVRSGCRSGWTTRSTAWNSAPGWTGPSTWSSPVWRWCARPNAPDPEGSGAAFRSEVRPRRAVAAGVRDGSGVGGLGRGRGGRRGRGLGRLGRVGGRPARIALRLALGIGLWLLRPALAAIGEVALAVAVLLEVGLVPAATGEAERRRGQGALHRGGAAGRAGIRIRVGKLLQAVEAVAALLAAVRIDGHGDIGRWFVSSAQCGGGVAESKPPAPTTYCCGALPHGAGGSSTGCDRSNSTLNSRPPGRVSS